MSDITDILTGRVNLKRNTSFLLDKVANVASHTIDRQPPKSSLLEVFLAGATVTGTALVNVYSSSGSGVAEYPVTDRTTALVRAFIVSDGALGHQSSGATALAEPIVEDTITGTNYKIFIDDGNIGWEVIVSSTDDSVILADTVDSLDRKLLISDGALGTTVISATSETFQFTDNGCAAGTIDFTTIAGITTSGLVDGFLSIRSVNAMGQPLNQEKVINSSMPVRFYENKGRIRQHPPGQDKVARYKIMAESTEDIEDNDLMYAISGIYGMTIGVIDFRKLIYGFDGASHHIEAEVKDL